MRKLTTFRSITSCGMLTLLAFALWGNAFAGPRDGDPGRPAKEKLSIDVVNECSLDSSNRYLEVTTTITLSGSDNGDGGATIDGNLIPTADAMFRETICTTHKNGKTQICETFFEEVNAPQNMKYVGSKTSDSWTFKAANSEYNPVDLCATKAGQTLSEGTSVNALISVPITYNDGSATWVSNCDDIDHYDDYDWVMVDGELKWMDVVDQSDVSLDKPVVCPST